MRINPLMALLIFTLFACKPKKSIHQKSQNTDTVVSVPHDTLQNHITTDVEKQIIAKDTILEFTIEGLSAESSEVKAHYINDTIKEAEWEIFGETGKCMINYTFLKDGTVKTSEKNYAYKSTLTEVKSKKDIHLKSSLQYIMDTSGKLLSKVNDKNLADVFIDFKQNVPLVLTSVEQLRH